MMIKRRWTYRISTISNINTDSPWSKSALVRGRAVLEVGLEWAHDCMRVRRQMGWKRVAERSEVPRMLSINNCLYRRNKNVSKTVIEKIKLILLYRENDSRKPSADNGKICYELDCGSEVVVIDVIVFILRDKTSPQRQRRRRQLQ